MRTIMYCNPI